MGDSDPWSDDEPQAALKPTPVSIGLVMHTWPGGWSFCLNTHVEYSGNKIFLPIHVFFCLKFA